MKNIDLSVVSKNFLSGKNAIPFIIFLNRRASSFHRLLLQVFFFKFQIISIQKSIIIILGQFPLLIVAIFPIELLMLCIIP